jgi:membrane protein YqaA with SNARE-associated domain
VRAAFLSFLGYFLTPAGLVAIAFLDASMVFYLPLGVDFVAILMAARTPHLFWLYAVLASIGSLMGGGSTYWIGRLIGEKELSRFIRKGQLERVKARLDRGVFVVAALALIPPPFPFTPFMLGAGAFALNPWAVFGLLVVARLLRFGCETALAARHGSQILHWMETPMFVTIVGVLIVLAVIGTIVSGVVVWRGARRDSGAPPRGHSVRPATRLR